LILTIKELPHPQREQVCPALPNSMLAISSAMRRFTWQNGAGAPPMSNGTPPIRSVSDLANCENRDVINAVVVHLYWPRAMPLDQRSNLALPFFHLQRDGFWHLIPRPGKEAIVEAIILFGKLYQFILYYLAHRCLNCIFRGK
jgi:hypothetical protein